MKITKPIGYTLLQLEEYTRLLEEEDPLGFYTFCQALDTEVHIELFNSFRKGQKSKGKEQARNLMERGYE